jgi:hypothetical protein
MYVREIKLIGRAMRERWPIPAQFKQSLMEILIKIAAEKTSTNRDKIQAIKALLAADAANVEAERLAIEQKSAQFELDQGRDRIANILAGLEALGGDGEVDGRGAGLDPNSLGEADI